MKELFDKLGIKPKDQSIYIQALTHSSYANEHQANHNERLEFLGDAVLQIIMSQYLYLNVKEDQGVLTKKRAQSVREEALHVFAMQINLNKYMLLGKGEIEKGANQAMIADAFEALFAAIYLDLGFDKAIEVFKRIIVPHLPLVDGLKDYKSQLQELVQVDRRTLSYRTIKIGGPANDPEFRSEVFLEDNIMLGTGIGSSKKQAEQNAAFHALQKVAKEVSYVKKTL